MPTWIIILTIIAYVAGLFLLAWLGDKNPKLAGGKPNRLGYALALGVYCTSWTYFGAVGTAVSSGWDYIWIYVGPTLVFLCAPHVVRRIGDITQRENISSLSDFLASRYGKSQTVAILAAIAAVTGSLPYIALQLKSVGMSFLALTQSEASNSQPESDTVLLTALAMAVFAILFGARQSDATKHNVGLMRVLAFESVIKLVALLIVAVLSVSIMPGGFQGVTQAASLHFQDYEMGGRAVAILLLAMAAIICLPRQFHVAMVERRSEDEVAGARWLFPLYMALTSLVVIPITVVGISYLPSNSPPDLFVLNLPLGAGHNLLALIVFLGGFSAATGMVIVSTIAISTMITNDIISPVFLRRQVGRGQADMTGERLVIIRRFVIVAVMLLAYGYFRVAQDSAALAQIGLLSFAAAAQFAPLLLGAVYWRRGTSRGAFLGLLTGMTLWLYTLFLPAIFGINVLASIFPDWLHPHSLLGTKFSDPLTHGVFWSLILNASVYVIASYTSRERLRDRVQAIVFTGSGGTITSSPVPKNTKTKAITPDGLRVLASRFLQSDAVTHAFDSFEKERGIPTRGAGESVWELVQFTEKFLARAIGSSSARIIMGSVIGGENVNFDDMLSLFEQRSQTQKFDEHLLQSMLENMPQGISVVDANQNLVAWNQAYEDLFDYPVELLTVGTPIRELIAYNVDAGWLDSASSEDVARRRVSHMKSGRNHVYERQHPDGRYIRIEGMAVPGGGYLTTFMDISDNKAREQELVELTERLEYRVRERTSELEELTKKLDLARQEAEGANASKTRFLAAASHDLLQPLNAARLFLGALKVDEPQTQLVNKVDQSIQSADNLLKGLLDISRLDHASVESHPTDIHLNALFQDLIEEAQPMAEAAGLDIGFVPTSLSVSADLDFLTSILRNLISNARRYTHKGRVLLGARRRGDQVRIEVWDTGVGISSRMQKMIFEEFQRAEDLDNQGVRGAGLGLSVASRMADLMGTQIDFRSEQGRGSVFWVTLPQAIRPHLGRTRTVVKSVLAPSFQPLTVLCIDDENSILEAMETLLESWNCNVLVSTTVEQALRQAKETKVHVVIADFQIGPGETGLDLIRKLRPYLEHPTNVCLLTARRSEDLNREAANDNVTVLNKPANPEDIQKFLMSCVPDS